MCFVSTKSKCIEGVVAGVCVCGPFALCTISTSHLFLNFPFWRPSSRLSCNSALSDSSGQQARLNFFYLAGKAKQYPYQFTHSSYNLKQYPYHLTRSLFSSPATTIGACTLGMCSNNQNGNLRWYLPWRGGRVSRGSRVPHTYSEKWFFLKTI